MKILWVLFTLFLATSVSYSQTLDQVIRTLAGQIAQKTARKNRTVLALADFTNNAGKSDPLTKYVTEQLENTLAQDSLVSIIERKEVKQLLAEHHLQSEGLIDQSTARSAISFIKADGWMTGEVTSFNDQVKISIKVIDVATSEIFAAASSGLFSDPAIQKLLESTASQNEPPVKKDCIEKNTGDYCFINDGSFALQYKVPIDVTIFLSDGNSVNATIQPGEKECAFNLPCGSYTYYALLQRVGPDVRVQYTGRGAYTSTGQVRVERCKTNVINLR